MKDYTPQNSIALPFLDSKRMILTPLQSLLESHLEGFKFHFRELREVVGGYGTAKAGSGIPKPHVYMREVTSKKKDYVETINTVSRGVSINYTTLSTSKPSDDV
jgi:hypothetical protein